MPLPMPTRELKPAYPSRPERGGLGGDFPTGRRFVTFGLYHSRRADSKRQKTVDNGGAAVL